jgi:SRSO17 transposase
MEKRLIYQPVREQEEKLAQFLTPFFSRAELLETALAYITRLSKPVASKNTWQLRGSLEAAYAFEHLLGRARWDQEVIRDQLQVKGLAAKEGGILVVDELSFAKQGSQSAGVGKQYNRMTKTIGNCQVGVFLSYVREREELLLDRELYIHPLWLRDREGCQKAKIPENLVARGKAELAQGMVGRAFSHGIKPSWVMVDQVYGGEELRLLVEKKECAYVVGVPVSYQVHIGRYVYGLKDLLAGIGSWYSLAYEQGKKGVEEEEWQRVLIDSPSPQGWARWVLIRKKTKEPKPVYYYVVFCRQETSLEELIKVVKSSWSIGKRGELGCQLGPYQVRSYVGWYRHMTLSLVGLLLLEGDVGRIANLS